MVQVDYASIHQSQHCIGEYRLPERRCLEDRFVRYRLGGFFDGVAKPTAPNPFPLNDAKREPGH
jgi:hypothetical protein